MMMVVLVVMVMATMLNAGAGADTFFQQNGQMIPVTGTRYHSLLAVALALALAWAVLDGQHTWLYAGLPGYQAAHAAGWSGAADACELQIPHRGNDSSDS